VYTAEGHISVTGRGHSCHRSPTRLQRDVGKLHQLFAAYIQLLSTVWAALRVNALVGQA